MDSQVGLNAHYLTAEGARALREELEYLKNVKRPDLAARLRHAIQQGDLSENADYHAAKEEQGFLEGRILELERLLRDSVILDEASQETGRVQLGTKVTVIEHGFDEHEVFQLVGRAEANPAQGKISNESPLGRALLGRKVGDVVRIAAPGGETVFKIIGIE
ncbi:MAG: transcription elongation factor GreA [Anaerolineae bacterium]|nr:transcription elongation factor GreA [Thermoflexales bacterium]MDW8406765.1 transcription elongation factor GreA [Anaerolineae bacterium]